MPSCLPSQVQVAALQNLVKIMSLYYQYMESYMGPALFAVSRVCVCEGVCLCEGVMGSMLPCAVVCPLLTDHSGGHEVSN